MKKWIFWLLAIYIGYNFYIHVIKQPLPFVISNSTNANVTNAAYTITPLQPYDITARVLSIEHYYTGREADISPMDFALAWDDMALPQNYNQISIRQSNRWFYWQTQQAPIALEKMAQQMANTHIIPANNFVTKQLNDIDKNDLVHLKGQLVKVEAPDGWHWQSSLSRNDTGAGACELFLVDYVQKIN